MVQQKVKYTDTERTPAERARALLEEMTLDGRWRSLAAFSHLATAMMIWTAGFGDALRDWTGEYSGNAQDRHAGRGRRMAEEDAGDVMRQSPHHIPAIFHMEGLCGALFRKEPVSHPESPEAQDGIRSWKRR